PPRAVPPSARAPQSFPPTQSTRDDVTRPPVEIPRRASDESDLRGTRLSSRPVGSWSEIVPATDRVFPPPPAVRCLQRRLRSPRLVPAIPGRWPFRTSSDA